MFFIAVIVLLVWYQSQAGKASTAELWFMMSMFAGGAYVGGFLDSRIFARLDKNRANQLAETEARYDAQDIKPVESVSDQPSVSVR